MYDVCMYDVLINLPLGVLLIIITRYSIYLMIVISWFTTMSLLFTLIAFSALLHTL